LRHYLCWSIQFGCDVENCGTPVKTHLTGDNSITKRAILRSRSRWVFQQTCPDGSHHPKLAEAQPVDVRQCLFPSL
jgi:hypothetical protein